MQTDRYLARIDYSGPLEPTADTLRGLHRAHMMRVPFENLDIHLGRPIVLSLPLLYDKIVLRRRGGFCYELNGLFAWLLEELGFPVALLSARVFEQGRFGPEFDHLVVMVELEERFLVDVGFGDSFLEPLRLDAPGEVTGTEQGRYRVSGSDGGLEVQRREEGAWTTQYAFTTTPRMLSEFDGMCRYHQTSPDSSFTGRSVCSLAREDGRVTLSDRRLIVTSGSRRRERAVADGAEYAELLRNLFGLELGEGVGYDRLMVPVSPTP